MPRFAANLSMLFTEVPFLERFGRAAASGFAAVEYLFPYAFPAAEIAAQLRGHGLEQALFNLPPGDWDAGERGIAALPGREEEFAAGVETALEYAAALDCPRLHAMAGIPAAGCDPREATAVYVANLRHAAARLAARGRTLLVEPINTRDMPGYFLSRQEQARELIELVGAPNLRLQFDVYHCQVMQGDLTRRLEELLPLIGHVQVADVPERHEPGSGEINYAHLFRTLDRLGYAGWVGCEYRPAGTAEAGLGWREALA
ncbi:MAG TPA: 2-oxo-tetronate isomerase [Gammaproteobacteria bacterium]